MQIICRSDCARDDSNHKEQKSIMIDMSTPSLEDSPSEFRRRRRSQERPRRSTRSMIVLGAPFAVLLEGGGVAAFTTSRSWCRNPLSHVLPPIARTQGRHLNAFDPKEEIWPPTNEDTVINLRDSFIGGARPQISPTTSSLSTTLSRPLWIRILPALLLIVYTLPHIQPIDGLLVIFFSGYLCVLAQWSKPSEGGQLTLPSEPVAAGRLPILERPLGPRLSSMYDTWQTIGGWIGLVLPWCLLASGVLDTTATLVLARPLYFLACQAVTETAAIRLPLPIRVLIPFIYAIIRLVSVYTWFTATTTMTSVMATTAIDSTPVVLLLQQALASLLLVYTLVHVVAVVPVVALRYLRVHFFLVEAAAVELRPGMEASMGFSPSDNDDGSG